MIENVIQIAHMVASVAGAVILSAIAVIACSLAAALCKPEKGK